MRILLLNQFFWPDSAATSQLLTDLARHLAREGNEIEVICAEGSYAVADAGEQPDVIVQRVKAMRFARGSVSRVLSYLSFYISASVRCLTVRKPDIVLTLTTPPLLSCLGAVMKLFRGTRHFIWEMDVYPDVAISLDYLKAGGFTERIIGTLADYSRRKADGIIALGDCMKERLMDRGLDGGKIFVAENWADGAAIVPKTRPEHHDKLVVLYSGNLGLAHDLDTITGAIKNLRLDDRFRFVFVGSGGRRDELAGFCEANEITSVSLRPYVPRANLGENLGAGDIGLVTQKDSCCGAVVPSKIYGLLAAGRPILFIGPKRATPSSIIERFECGWQVNCGDVSGLTELLESLATNKRQIEVASQNARRAFLQNYDLPLGVARIAAILGVVSKPQEGLRLMPLTQENPELLVRS